MSTISFPTTNQIILLMFYDSSLIHVKTKFICVFITELFGKRIRELSSNIEFCRMDEFVGSEAIAGAGRPTVNVTKLSASTAAAEVLALIKYSAKRTWNIL